MLNKSNFTTDKIESDFGVCCQYNMPDSSENPNPDLTIKDLRKIAKKLRKHRISGTDILSNPSIKWLFEL